MGYVRKVLVDLDRLSLQLVSEQLQVKYRVLLVPWLLRLRLNELNQGEYVRCRCNYG